MKRTFRPLALLMLALCFVALSTPSPRVIAGPSPATDDFLAIPQAVKQFIADAHFNGKIDSPAFKNGVRRLRLDRVTFNDIMKNSAQRRLFEFYNGESIIVAVTGPAGAHHLMVFKAREEGDENNSRFKVVDDNYKLLYQRANLPEAHFKAVIEILKPIKQVELPQEEPAADDGG